MEMATPKRYIHDRVILLLLTADVFFTILTSVLLLLRLDSGRSGVYTIQYRPSLGLSGYLKGDRLGLLSFAIFAVLVLVFHTFMSIKVYPIRRQLSVVILGMALLLIILALVMSNALLLLR
jgi:hypothetical protein